MLLKVNDGFFFKRIQYRQGVIFQDLIRLIISLFAFGNELIYCEINSYSSFL